MAIELLSLPKTSANIPTQGADDRVSKAFGPYVSVAKTGVRCRGPSPLDAKFEQALELLAQPRHGSKQPLKLLEVSPVTGEPKLTLRRSLWALCNRWSYERLAAERHEPGRADLQKRPSTCWPNAHRGSAEKEGAPKRKPPPKRPLRKRRRRRPPKRKPPRKRPASRERLIWSAAIYRRFLVPAVRKNAGLSLSATLKNESGDKSPHSKTHRDVLSDSRHASLSKRHRAAPGVVRLILRWCSA